MNKTKNKTKVFMGLIIFLITSMISAPLVTLAAPGVPFAVQGQVTLDGLVADGASVVITDANTGAFLTDTVGSALSGWYGVDLANLSIAATTGDTINIKATINSLNGTTSFIYNPALGYINPPIINIITPPATSFNITASAGTNGTVTPAGVTAVNSGANQTYAITPNTGFNIASILVDGVSVATSPTYTFTNVTAAHTISATFTSAPLPTFTITAATSTNGIITPPGVSNVTSGTNQTYTITPNSGFNIVSVLVDGISKGAINTYTFNNVVAPHTISATFVAIPPATYSITASAGGNGNISPLGTTSILSGGSQVYTITPSTGFYVLDVLVDSVSKGAITTYTFTNIIANHTISATFTNVAPTYTIVATSGANGMIMPMATSTVISGANKTFTITPNTGYNLATLLIDGVATTSAATYTFTNVVANHTISATFSAIPAPTTYTITSTAGTNGTITPTATVISGANATFTITPNSGYNIATLLIDGATTTATSTYTFTNVTSNHTIDVTFSAIPAPTTYTITSSAGVNGTISTSTSVISGANSTFTITPDPTFNIADVLVDGVTVGAVSTYTFTNVTANHTISATFSATPPPVTFTINSTAGANGTITPAGLVTLNPGVNQTYTITPNSGYNIADVLVDGVTVGAVSTYTFTNVTASHTIDATFSVIPVISYMITATAGANGTITPSGTITLASGANQTYTINPAAGYNIATLLVDGSAVTATSTYTFTNLISNHTINATFAAIPPLTYTIVTTSDANGMIMPMATSTVTSGANLTFTITPNTGYNLATLLIDGATTTATSTYTFSNVTANHTIDATFSAIPLVTYTITATSDANGMIMPMATSTVISGANLTFTITPNTGYNLATLLIDGATTTATSTYTFTNVTANHTISATFSLIPVPTTYTITSTAGANGTISTSTSVVSGANSTFTITPDSAYNIADVLVDGTSVGAITTYTFTNVIANHTISATFSVIPVSSGGGGGGGSYVSTCSTVNYGEWGVCVNGNQYRNVLNQTPNSCSLSVLQQLARSKPCDFVVSPVVPTPVVTPETKPTSTKQVLGEKKYADGTLLRGSDNKVHVVMGNTIKHITSLKELATYKGPILKVSDATINSFTKVSSLPIKTTIANGSLIKGSDNKIYVITNQHKVLIKTLTELKKYAGKNIQKVTDTVLNTY